MFGIAQDYFSPLLTNDYIDQIPLQIDPDQKADKTSHTIAVDAEWQSKLAISLKKSECKVDVSIPLTVQYFHRESGRKLVYIAHEYYLHLQQYALLSGIELIPWGNFDKGTLEDALERLGLENDRIRLLMFYSPKDLRYAFGKGRAEDFYLKARLTKKRGVTNRRGALSLGASNQISIHDLSGWAAKGLAQLATAVGVEMTDKHELDDYKWRMNEALVELPETFLRYAMGDTSALVQIFEKYVELVRKVQATLGIPEDEQFTEDTIPRTTGSIVAKTLGIFLRNQASNKKAYDFAIKKLGILEDGDETHKKQTHKKQCDSLNKLRHEVKTTADLERKDLQKDLKTIINSNSFDHIAINQTGVKYFVKQQDTSVYLSIVQGGRCNNELSTSWSLKGVALDIDEKSCYGSTLKEYTYPIGLPTVISQYDQEKRMTLREFMARYGSELVPNLWHIVVSGELPFRQDLVFSKVVGAKTIRSLNGEGYDKDDSVENRTDVSHIPGDFLLCQMEIYNGIINSDILEAIERVSSNSEKKAWFDLEVQAAAFYPKSDRIDSIDEWIDHVLQDKGERIVVGNRHGNNKDDRTRKWVGIPMMDFTGILVEERERAKDNGESAYQEALKLFINTTYGVIASPFFEIGNTILANNITARARLGAWMMNKALHTVQSITDGGAYSPLMVAYLKPDAKLPGFDKLADISKWKDTKNYKRTIASLEGLPPGITWDQWVLDVKAKFDTLQTDEERKAYEKELGEFLNTVTKNHIDKFWSLYGLKFPFNIEHKVQNISTAMAFFNKGDYAFRTVAHGDVFKSRGNKDFSQLKGPSAELKPHPIYELLRNVLDGKDTFPTSMEYNKQYLLSPTRWVQAQKSKDGYHHIADQHPGDEIIETYTARFNNTHIPILRLKDYNRRNDRKKINHAKPVKRFERYAEKGIASVVQAMNDDRLI
ncbi:hypothetical protein H6F89_33930 [Cyanobacteria bacterium FACHB-63]|nr:hypothetical protein [Cyanobacteria bacterium FACHB-63]